MANYQRNARAFTLIEMLIVAALISLFSAMAIFSMDYLVNSSKRKASIADVSTIAKSLSLAYFDLSLFPQIGYLSMSQQEMWLLTNNNRSVLPPYFDHMGFDTLHGRAGSIYTKWATGQSGQSYLPSSRSRSALAPTGYTTRVLIPGSNVVLDWPADPYGNPYVLYTVDIDEDGYAAWPTSPTGRGNYQSLVVCYGRNGIPGGYDVTEPGRQITAADRDAVNQAYALYTPIPSSDPRYVNYQFIALRASEYTLPRLDPMLGAYSPGVGNLGQIPGIMENGSDDLTAPIP